MVGVLYVADDSLINVTVSVGLVCELGDHRQDIVVVMKIGDLSIDVGAVSHGYCRTSVKGELYGVEVFVGGAGGTSMAASAASRAVFTESTAPSTKGALSTGA